MIICGRKKKKDDKPLAEERPGTERIVKTGIIYYSAGYKNY